MTDPKALAEKICGITNVPQNYVALIIPLLTEMLEHERFFRLTLGDCEWGKDCQGFGCTGASHYWTLDEVRAEAYDRAAEVAEKHPDCTDRGCLEGGKDGCGIAIATAIRALKGGV